MKESFLQGMTTTVQSQATRDLIDVLTPYVTFEDVPANTQLHFSVEGVNLCYILLSGLVKVGRSTDDFVISSITTPNILGISNSVPHESGLYIETVSEARIATLPTARANEIIAQNNAWELLAGHMTVIASNLYKKSVLMTAATTYDVMKFQLIALMQEPADLRESHSAAKYILERTRLSRSTVMKMLSQLKLGGYIEIEDGVLKTVHRLPDKY
ncbi:helix-turn-helix domain-containing protein [Scandinavium sp. H11S7]|uniref:winged helix-turn-helix transcriptional regulator n=1 Tax=Scandinavium hiltneri TaxID=2926519 RepID=UPI002165BF7C|nr:winged helix-turn-helix transcriptional regulator [Scandinavium hiltneri]MCS2158151.1 helix-turn-helix domain-containing protein [Scandinavium hiltneri]